jgi:pimeloyl-ACP methyl ester carboxylesterase
MKKHSMTMGGSWLAGAIFAVAVGHPAFGQVTPPLQPTTGPGSAQYLYGVLQSGPFTVSGQSKKSGYTYYTFTPVGMKASQSNPNPLPTPKSAPVVLVLSAEDGAATAYSDYLFLLEQLAAFGYTVVFPNYTQNEFQKDYAAVVQADLKDGLNQLTTNTTLVKPTLGSNGEPLYTVVGHSEGGYLALNLAATAVQNGVPVPAAVVSYEANPGKLPAFNAQAIDPSTLVILLVGDDDDKNRICPSVTVWSQLTQIASVYKPFLYARSDSTGTPAQLANHWFPLTYTNKDTLPTFYAVDNRDWNITYKLSVAATACTAQGLYCDYALGNGPQNQYGVTTQTDLGFWSNGQQVLPLVLEINPVLAFSTSNCSTK